MDRRTFLKVSFGTAGAAIAAAAIGSGAKPSTIGMLYGNHLQLPERMPDGYYTGRTVIWVETREARKIIDYRDGQMELASRWSRSPTANDTMLIL